MAHAEVCPVCQGRGSIKNRTYTCLSTIIENLEDRCHGCQGKGWVEVSDEKSESYPAYYIVPTTTA